MNTETSFVIVVMFAVGAGVFIIYLALKQRSYRIELMHRERMAMIERGITPPPEMAGPVGSLIPPSPEMYSSIRDQRRSAASKAQMTFGIVVIGAGLAFMTVIGIAAQSPEVALGLGGAAVIFGAALIVISQVHRQPDPYVTATNIRIPRTPPVPPIPPSAAPGDEQM